MPGDLSVQGFLVSFFSRDAAVMMVSTDSVTMPEYDRTAMTYTSHDRPLAMPATCITRRLDWKNGSNAANDATMAVPSLASHRSPRQSAEILHDGYRGDQFTPVEFLLQ